MLQPFSEGAAKIFDKDQYRLEADAFGDIPVPKDKYYGANTARSIINFAIGDETERMPVGCWHLDTFFTYAV